MGQVSSRLCAAMVVIAVVPCVVGCTAGTPERPAPGPDHGFKLPYSYENTRCFAACAETIAQLKAEEEAKKRAEAEAKERATEAAARKASEARRRSRKASSSEGGGMSPTIHNWYCTGCGVLARRSARRQAPSEVYWCSECNPGL